MKKFIAGALSLAMLLTVITVTAKEYPQKFYDVPKGHWAFEYIAELVDRGAINGYEDGSYKPDNTVARAEWAKIMVVAANRQLGSSTPSFTDMAGHWGNQYVNAAKDYMTSYEGGAAFRPDIAALREDVTVALVKLKGYDINNADFSYTANFTDQKSISNDCRKYVAVAVEKGLINGFEDGTFRGQGTLTRAEAATLLWRAFQVGNDDKVVDGSGGTPTTPNNPDTTPAPGITPSPTEETTATPEPTATPKPYKVDTIIKADVADAYLYTADGNDNIYYIDKTANKVVKVNIYTKQKEDILDISTIKFESDAVDYWDFVIDNLYYDTHSNKLLASGSYKQMNGYAENMGGTYELPGLKLVTDKKYRGHIIGTLNNGNYVTCYYGQNDFGSYQYTLYMLDNGFNETVITSQGMGPVYSVVQSGADIYFAANKAYSCIYKYDFTNLNKLFDINVYDNAATIKGQKVFAFEGNSAKIYNLSGKTLTEISKDDIAVADMSPITLNSVMQKLIITKNEDITYYDTSVKAFRIISKNDKGE